MATWFPHIAPASYPPQHSGGQIEVVKLNSEWSHLKSVYNGKKHVTEDFDSRLATDIGVSSQGISPNMDDKDLPISHIDSWIPPHNSKFLVYLALFLLFLLYHMQGNDADYLAKLTVLCILSLVIIVYFRGWHGPNVCWFLEDVGGVIRSAMAESFFVGFTYFFIVIGLNVLTDASKEGGFPTTFLIGIGGYVSLLPVYFILWIFTKFPVRYTGNYLIAT